MPAFLEMVEARQGELESDVFDLLLTVADFDSFKARCFFWVPPPRLF